MSFKLYEILGVSKNASSDEIKKAYKKLAMTHHPDKNPNDKEADVKFREISNAYSVLSDEEQKQRYDHLGDENFNNDSGGGQSEVNVHDMFQHFFGRGGGNPFGGGDPFAEAMFGGGFRHHGHPGQQQNKCNNILKEFQASLDDVYYGINKNLTLKITHYCKSCIKTCENCNGNGMIQQMIKNGFMTQIITSHCGNCNGSGTVTKGDKSCSKCSGNGTYEVDNLCNLIIGKGFEDNVKTVFNNLGEQPKKSNQQPGNLILEIKIQDHPYFVRKGNDLYYKVNITLSESILGKDISITYFDDVIKININQFGIINPHKQYIIKNRGMPIMNSDKKGNMYLEFTINYPKLEKDEVSSLSAVLSKAFKY
jgi:DnaJ-class molecular chaperone